VPPTTPEGPPVVAVFNTSADTTELLRIALEHAGFVVITAYTYDLREGRRDLDALMRTHRPRVIVYDIALPYDVNWRLFEHIRHSPACAGTAFVLTTTNAARVRDVIGEAGRDILEIVGKPYDLDQLIRLVRQAWDGGHPRAVDLDAERG
jgi:DNA-binding NtrC family response regulator